MCGVSTVIGSDGPHCPERRRSLLGGEKGNLAAEASEAPRNRGITTATGENAVQRLILGAVLLLGALELVLILLHGQWRRFTERERFLLGLKDAAAAERMCPEERARLRLLRSRW